MMYAQDYIKNASGDTLGGFNSRLQALSFQNTTYGSRGKSWAERAAGWNLADAMIKAGEIFSEVKGIGVIKCFKDGNTWCCVGEGFVDLMESQNFAFGSTQKNAISAYAQATLAQQEETEE